MWDTPVQKINDSVAQLSQSTEHWMSVHLFNILIIVVGAYVLCIFGTKFMTTLMQRTLRQDLYPTELDRKKRLRTLNALIGAIIRVAVWLVAITMIISELGVNTAPLLASAGVIGITLGVGAQSLIKDFVNGMFIIIENQYRVGDVVEIGNTSGVVEAITIRTTILRDLDGNVHHVPNGTISVATNKTMDYGNINIDITVASDTKLARLEHLINHVGEQMANVPDLKLAIKDPPHFERVVDLTSNGIVVKILGRTTPGDQWRVRGELYKQLKSAFDEHDIIIPTDQLTIHQARKK